MRMFMRIISSDQRAYEGDRKYLTNGGANEAVTPPNVGPS